jgi:fucose 4-O-acetylase-like acetyltransferase
MKSRESWVDYAKAIGIILVVYGHVARGLYNGGIDISITSFELIDSVVYSFHMPLFFFLSGLFFYKSFSKNGGAKLIFSKVDTVFYPYVIWSLLQGSVQVLLSNYTNGNVTLVKVFSVLWSPGAQFWFLYALFAIFILSSVVYSLISKRFTLLIFICSVALYLYPVFLPQGFIFRFISSNFVFFVLGIIFTMYLKTVYFTSWLTCLSLALSFMFGQWLFHGYLSYGYMDKGVESLLLACISIAFVVSISLLLSRSNFKYLAYIGSSSMGIYLMHIFAASGSRVILSKALKVDSVAIHLVIGCLMGVVAPLIALFLIDKVKLKYVLSAPVSSSAIKSYNKLSKGHGKIITFFEKNK